MLSSTSGRSMFLGCVLLMVGFVAGVSRAETAPATVFDDPAILVQTRADLAAGKGPHEALVALKKEGDKALTFQVCSVMDKPEAGPSHDKHDYVSFAPYFFPDPKTKDGLPYVRHDGHRNTPQIEKGDSIHYEPMLKAIHTLGLAYWYTGNRAYADHAAKLARVWFLDPATRMNPNFKYAQAVVGENDGRHTGLLENRGLVLALDGLTMIDGSGAWSASDASAMRAWVTAFHTWLMSGDAGAGERAATNNHGSWFAVQEATLDLWLGGTAKAKTVFLAAKGRIAKQIEPTGREPLELVRTDGFSYSVFNVQALSALAGLAKRQGVDLWADQKGGSLKKAIDYLMPFASAKEKWTEKQLKPFSAGGLVPVILAAAPIYREAKYQEWLEGEKELVEKNMYLLTGTVGIGGGGNVKTGSKKTE